MQRRTASATTMGRMKRLIVSNMYGPFCANWWLDRPTSQNSLYIILLFEKNASITMLKTDIQALY